MGYVFLSVRHSGKYYHLPAIYDKMVKNNIYGNCKGDRAL
jgi:hypothetical protein